MSASAVWIPLRAATQCLLAVLSAAACSQTDVDPETARPVARVAAVDTLLESDTIYVARVSRAYMAPDGRTFVTDQVQRRVLEFASDGALLRVFGRSGDGPGEFRGPTAMSVWGRDSLVVTDLTNRRVSVFRQSDGQFLWHANGLGSVSSLGPVGSRLIVASLSPDSFTTVGILEPGSRTLRPALPLPDSLLRHQLGIASFPRSVVGVSATHVVTAVLWSDVVSVFDSALAPQFSFVVPRRTRRAIPVDLAAALRPVANTSGRSTLMPALISIEVLRNGWLAFVHKEWIAPPGGISDPTRVAIEATMHAYVTVVDLSARRACADIELPTDWSENPQFISVGETIAGVGHVVGASARPTLEVRKFELQLDECDWAPLPVSAS